MLDVLNELNRGAQPTWTTCYVDRRFELVKIILKRLGLGFTDIAKPGSRPRDIVAFADAVLAELNKEAVTEPDSENPEAESQ